MNALAAGARDFVEKPFDITEVVPRVSNMLKIRLLDNQVRDQSQILEKKVTARTPHTLKVYRRKGDTNPA